MTNPATDRIREAMLSARQFSPTGNPSVSVRYDDLAALIGQGEGDAARTIEILRRALAWHGDPQRMATTREEWQQTIDEAISWVKANPEPERLSFSSYNTTPPPPENNADRLAGHDEDCGCMICRAEALDDAGLVPEKNAGADAVAIAARDLLDNSIPNGHSARAYGRLQDALRRYQQEPGK